MTNQEEFEKEFGVDSIPEELDKVRLLSECAKEMEAKRNFSRYATGIKAFDDVAKLREGDGGGLALGDIVIIAAPTGNGKTSICQTLSYDYLSQGLHSLWFTYEVSVWHLWEKFKNMGAREDDFLFVPSQHTTGNVEWILKKIREAKKLCDISMVVIDHLGFLAPSQKMNGSMSQNYASYLAQIVRELKKIALEEQVIILLPVHMNKTATDDPQLSDIGNSSGIAQEADFVFLMARERSDSASEYYTPYTRVKLAKNRESGITTAFWMEKIGGKLYETVRTEKVKKSKVNI